MQTRGERSRPGASDHDSAMLMVLEDHASRLGRLEADNATTKATLQKVVDRGTLYMGPREWMRVGAALVILALVLWDRAPGLARLAARLAGVPSGLIGS